MQTPLVEILINESNGSFIPQIFAGLDGWIGISESDREILLEGPDGEFYWEAWARVLDGACYMPEGGPIYRIHQEGDLLAYRPPESEEEADQLRDLLGE